MSELTDKEKFALLGENYIESVLGKQFSFCKTEKAEEFVQNTEVHMTFTDRVLELINERGISKNKLLGDLNLGRNSFINWIQRGTIPSADTVYKIAKYFDVSTDYLLGKTDIKKQAVPEGDLSAEKKAMLDYVNSLTDEECGRVLASLKLLFPDKKFELFFISLFYALYFLGLTLV